MLPKQPSEATAQCLAWHGIHLLRLQRGSQWHGRVGHPRPVGTRAEAPPAPAITFRMNAMATADSRQGNRAPSKPTASCQLGLLFPASQQILGLEPILPVLSAGWFWNGRAQPRAAASRPGVSTH